MLSGILKEQTPRRTGKPEPNPVADMKMMRSTESTPEELDYNNAPTPNYIVEDLIKMVSMKGPSIKGGNEAAYKEFVNQVAYKVRELGLEYSKLSEIANQTRRYI